MTLFVFDIETAPDLTAGRQLYDLHDLSDQEVLDAMNKIRREATGGSEFQRIHLHRVVSISLAMKTEDSFAVWSLGKPESTEAELIHQFFAGINKYEPQLVSWNGGGFDLPVLNHRAFINGIQAPQYWETGDNDRDYRFDNYLSRYHWRHLDLMDVLASFSPRANAPLDEMAQLIGLPGKIGIGGAQVGQAFVDGKIEEIRQYCEIDVLNTYLLYCRFQLLRGKLSRAAYHEELMNTRDSLAEFSVRNPLFEQYLEQWNVDEIKAGQS